MKARFASTVFCECNRGMEHVGSDYLRCNNPACQHHGKRFEIPTLELTPVVTEAVAGDLGIDLAGQPLNQ